MDEIFDGLSEALKRVKSLQQKGVCGKHAMVSWSADGGLTITCPTPEDDGRVDLESAASTHQSAE